MTPEYEAQIRDHVATMKNFSLGNLFARDLLAEVDRLRKALLDTADQVAERDNELGGVHVEMDRLRRESRHHQDGKARWRSRAEKAEARVAEYERPSTESERNALRQSFAELTAQAREDRDYEGAFNVECDLRKREEQWKREDAANARSTKAVELAEGLAGLDAMRADHPAPCRVPDSPDCTCAVECPSCGAPADVTGYRIPEHRTGCPLGTTL